MTVLSPACQQLPTQPWQKCPTFDFRNQKENAAIWNSKTTMAWLYYKLVQRIAPVNGRNVRQGFRKLSFCVARLQRNNLVTFQQRRGLCDVHSADPVASAFLNNAVIVARQVGTQAFEVHMSRLPKPADGGRIFHAVGITYWKPHGHL